MGDYVYSQDGSDLYIHQYMGNTARVLGGVVNMRTVYPVDGEIDIQLTGVQAKKLRLRIPGWCRSFTLNVPYELEKSYAVMEAQADMHIRLHLDMPVELMQGHPSISSTAGKVAVMRRPVVYCLEGVDNEGALDDVFLKADGAWQVQPSAEYGLPVLTGEGWRMPPAGGDWLYRPYDATLVPKTLHLIPYYAFANRGPSDMKVWVPVK